LYITWLRTHPRHFGQDHSLEGAIPVAAVALGAAVIEKHLILDRAEGGPDAAFSSDPSDFARLVREVT
jgi:pseudaminic acid synthase